MPRHSCSVRRRDLGRVLESSLGRITWRYSLSASAYFSGEGSDGVSGGGGRGEDELKGLG